MSKWNKTLNERILFSFAWVFQVSKALHAAEGQEKQAKQHAASLKSAAYAAQALAGRESHIKTGSCPRFFCLAKSGTILDLSALFPI